MTLRFRALSLLSILALLGGACGGDPKSQEQALPADGSTAMETGQEPAQGPTAGSQGQESGSVVEQGEIDPRAQAFLEVRTFFEGKPHPGVHFDVYWLEDGFPAKTASQTGPEGVRRVPFDHGSQLVRVSCNPSGLTAPRAVEEHVTLQGGRTHVIEVELKKASIVSGVVLDELGNPVPEADVYAFFSTPERLEEKETPSVGSFTKTNDEGRFRLGGIPAGPFVLEAATADQGTVWRPAGWIGEGLEIRDLEILVEPSMTVYGQVSDEAEVAIAGATVVAGVPNRRRVKRPTTHPEVFHIKARGRLTRSDEQGTFQLAGVPESQGWIVNVSHPEYKGQIQVLDPGQIDVWIELQRGANLRGQVLAPEGHPISGAQAWLVHDGKELTSFSQPSGEYIFGGLDPMTGAYLIFFKPGEGMALIGPLDVEKGMATVDAVLDRSLVLSGTVTDASGAALPGAGVRIEGVLPEPGFPTALLPERFLDRYALLTSADGSFRFDDLYPGPFTVTVSAPGHAKLVVEDVVPGPEPLELQLAD